MTSDGLLRVPVDFEDAQSRVPAFTKGFEDLGYPHPFLMMQITNIRYHDNGSPQPALPDFIRRFNATNPKVRLRFAALSEVFDRFRAEPAATPSEVDQPEPVDVEEAEIGDLEVRNNRKWQEGHLEEWFRKRAAELARGRSQREQAGPHGFVRLKAHQAG